jgi:CheY-like chemotaxis protein
MLVKAQQIVERQVRHMARLVDDLLDVSRISSGKILLRPARMDLCEVVRSAADDYRAEAKAAGVEIAADIPEHPLWIQGDATRLAQSVGNLLNNAIKFSDSGGRVSVGIEEDPGAGLATVRVRDTGIGMTPEVLRVAFEPFAQADNSPGRSHGGLGLGLPLVKALVELHHGSVEARSDGLGSGSEFLLRLPLHAPPSQPEREDTGERVARRVLIIEDNEDAAEAACLLLESAGHDVVTAATGAAGVDMARSFKPDLVLCDIGLPGDMDGYGVAQTLRADPATDGIFLVAMTGFGREEDLEHAYHAGFDKHLTKPVDPDALLRLISNPQPLSSTT